MRTFREETKLSSTKEDYLRAIYLLHIKTNKPVGVTKIAERLHLSKSTVSERVQDLVSDGLASTAPYAGVTLTEAGTGRAEKLTYKHRIIEVFLHRILQVPASQVHAEAERLEHACSDDVIKRLAIFLNHPTTDPHGTVITKPNRW
ncbi:metal-dependent transcriptional regulator [Candidatus Kaiserbacteria bacterium]|nr:metal-dependent transcriptional regulator [Candidatus Kaiserbacteria bacterium]